MPADWDLLIMMLRTALASLALCLSVDAFTVNVAPAGRAALARPCHAMRRGMQLPATRMSAGEPVLAPKPVLATGDSAAKTPGYGPHIKIGKSEKILNPWGLWVLTYSMVLAFAGYFYLKFRQILSTVLFGLVKGPSPEHCCWIMHKWCNLVLRIGMSAPQVTGLENLPPIDEPVLVCANHMSWFDVPSLHGFLGGRLLWSFAKAELVKVPVLGTYMKSAEHILISRTSRKSQLESLKTAISTLQGLKRNVFIFPEGTRSLDGKLREFKGGAFTIARKANVKIVPVTLMGNDVVFPANALMPICPGGNFMRLVVHPAIDPTGKTDDELMVLTREAIRSALPADKRD
mmetsp:Transcript_38912/g.92077  ORF Transcript_38912/g.92077 Transcript_38912/m.92077 type:complete len:346 (-) Transcript_38912:171-1208(-)